MRLLGTNSALFSTALFIYSYFIERFNLRYQGHNQSPDENK